MKSKAEKGLTCKCRKIILFSVIALPLAFAGCKKDNPPIEHPTVKSMTQSVNLDNSGVKIVYSASLSNVNKAKLEVKREGVLISTEEISDISSIGGRLSKDIQLYS